MPARPDRDLVNDLDDGIQARFRNVREKDIADGNLGVSRFAVLGLCHRGTIRRELRGEYLALESISLAGWRTAIYVVEARSAHAEPVDVIGPIVAEAESWDLFQNVVEIEDLAFRSMSSRAPAQGVGPGVSLEVRPIFASQAKCLQCHRKGKLGDSLGAVVYAFRPEGLVGFLGLVK